MLPEAEQVKAIEALEYLLDFLKRRGVEMGCEPDYDGGSSGDDLRFLRIMLQKDLDNPSGRKKTL